ncbi:MAG: hypothetical protein ACI9K2_006988 [Myxococcota bacterium]|jgi:hypothetical protein
MLLSLLAGTALACPSAPADPVAVVSIARDPVLDRAFSIEDEGWLGSDIAHSVPIAPDRSVWLFGDTFWGTSTGDARDGGWRFENGSIALHDPTRPESAPTFYRSDDPTGFFAHRAPSAGDYYWTTNGFVHDGALVVLAMNVVSLFRQDGFSMLRVPDPLLDPADWTWEVTHVPLGDEAGLPITAAVVDEPWLYLFGFDDRTGPRRTVLARAPTDALTALVPEDVIWWDGEGWSADPESAATLLADGTTESHVVWVPAIERWVFTLTDAFSGDLRMSTARELTGPWTPSRCVFHVPEADRVDDLWSYAFRAHPEYSEAPDEVVLSYVTNPFGGVGPLFGPHGGQLYRPRFLRMRVAPNVAPALEGPAEVAPSERVRFTVTDALPGETVDLVAGREGSTPRSRCPAIPVAGPIRLGARRADEHGVAEWAVTVPEGAVGAMRVVAVPRERCPTATLDLRVE